MEQYKFTPLKQAEALYTFKQSAQISAQTGLIGYLSANMDMDGNGFFSNWTDHRRDLKTEEFKTEFDNIINFLRAEGNPLHNRKAMANYCYPNLAAKIKSEDGAYGIRVDTEEYACLFRLIPSSGIYNVYCYCYKKDWLDGHMKAAEKGIRFIDSNYNELFRIPDGSKIIIHYSWDEDQIRVCRYIDEYHVEVGDNLYHICEFAERMEQNGHTYELLREDLPERCYSILSENNEIIVLKRNEKGYYKTDIAPASKEDARALVNEYNANLGVTRAQEEAMKGGSMFGWCTPASYPSSYDENGKAKR